MVLEVIGVCVFGIAFIISIGTIASSMLDNHGHSIKDLAIMLIIAGFCMTAILRILHI